MSPLSRWAESSIQGKGGHCQLKDQFVGGGTTWGKTLERWDRKGKKSYHVGGGKEKKGRRKKTQWRVAEGFETNALHFDEDRCLTRDDNVKVAFETE